MIKLDQYRDTWMSQKFDEIIGFYPREFYPLDNFSSFKVEYNGYLYSSAEEAFQANLFIDDYPEIAEENINEFIFWMNELSLENPQWTITDFLLYIDELNTNKIQVKSPNISFEDAVEISTIHAVKGAASSVVILAFTDSRIVSTKPQISFNSKLGFGIKYFDIQKRTLGTTPFKEKIDELNSKNDESEEIRLLYVALTRARDLLYIIGKGDSKSINNSLLGFILKNLQDQNISKSSLFDIKNISLDLS